MILAAGMGTRLRPLTDHRPKALVEVAGRTLLELTLARLRSFGIRDIIINVHHFADDLIDYLARNANFGLHIEVSREDVLLDTGGGLMQAGAFFHEPQAEREHPFLVHNVDVLSDIDFSSMLRSHTERRALATLAVQDRATSRSLLFDEHHLLCGRVPGWNTDPEVVRDCAGHRSLAFCGIHMLSPRIFSLMHERGAFPIIPAYLRLASEGELIQAFDATTCYWRDLGKPEQIEAARGDMESGKYQPL